MTDDSLFQRMVEVNDRRLEKQRTDPDWEKITRKLLVLGQYGYSMDYYIKYFEEPDFLSIEWLESYHGYPLEQYVKDELDAVDLLLSHGRQ